MAPARAGPAECGVDLDGVVLIGQRFDIVCRALVIRKLAHHLLQAATALAHAAQTGKELVAKRLDAIGAVLRHGGEGAHERSLGSRGKVRDELAGVGGTADDAAERVAGRGGHKGSAAAQALIDNAGKGKDIGALVNRASLDIELLGWHVADGAAARAAKAAGRRQTCHAKVGELNVARVVDEHVGRLDVQVEHAIAMGEGERLAQRVGNGRGLVKGERMAVHAMQKLG